MRSLIEKRVSFFAETVIKHQVNSACVLWFYQERIPEKAVQKYKRKMK